MEAALDKRSDSEVDLPMAWEQVERLLDGVDAVVYLLDYTKLRTNEEAALFTRLKQINPGLLRRLSLRLRFVVNKIDTIRGAEGLDEEETKVYVANLVTQQLSGEGFQLLPEQVLLVSAQEALLSRLMLRQNPLPSLEAQKRFRAKAFGTSRAAQKKVYTLSDLNAAAEEMLAESGMWEVEEQVLQTFYQQAGPLKLMAIVDDTHRMLSQMSNTAAVSETALEKDVEQLRREAAALQSQLTDTLARFDDVQGQTASLETEVVDEVRTRLHFLGEQLTDKVTAVLAGATEDAPPVPSGRWHGIWEKTRGFLGRRQAGAGLEELQHKLQALHADIFATIDEEVRAFWHQLEMASNERQRTLLQRLNAHLEGLSRAIEQVVAEGLSVRLQPVDLRLEKPSAASFHHSLQALFDAGITQKSVTRERSRQVEGTQWVKQYRNGICRLGEYYVGQPITRTVTETYTETEFEIQPDKIQEYFADLIYGTVEASVRSVRAFVKEYMSAALEQARASITSYAERFTNAMLVALTTSEMGEKARLAALEHVRGHKVRLAALLVQTFALQAKAEALFPTAAASLSRAPSLEFDEEDLFLNDGEGSTAAAATGSADPFVASGPVADVEPVMPAVPEAEQPAADGTADGARRGLEEGAAGGGRAASAEGASVAATAALSNAVAPPSHAGDGFVVDLARGGDAVADHDAAEEAQALDEADGAGEAVTVCGIDTVLELPTASGDASISALDANSESTWMGRSSEAAWRAAVMLEPVTSDVAPTSTGDTDSTDRSVATGGDSESESGSDADADTLSDSVSDSESYSSGESSKARSVVSMYDAESQLGSASFMAAASPPQPDHTSPVEAEATPVTATAVQQTGTGAVAAHAVSWNGSGFLEDDDDAGLRPLAGSTPAELAEQQRVDGAMATIPLACSAPPSSAGGGASPSYSSSSSSSHDGWEVVGPDDGNDSAGEEMAKRSEQRVGPPAMH